MAKTKDRLFDKADDVRPYVDRALHDDELRDNLKEAFAAAREVYAELMGGRGMTGTATRLATDKDIQENLKKAVEELKSAANRVQGKEDHTARNAMLLLAGITAGILFNPVTGAATRKWLMERIGGADDYEYDYGTNAGSSAGGTGTGADASTDGA